MNLKMNCLILLRQLLPPHKRQPVRMKLLTGFLSPLQSLFDGFDIWRDNSRMMINVNSQVKVFEGYLRKKYNEPISIKIVTFNNGLLLVGLISEGNTMWPDVGLEEENRLKAIPLENEIRDKFDDADFIVYIPKSVDKIQIEAEIEKYKQVLTTYKIIQQ
jgi:hypothetical protein bfra3_06982|nr:MAG TPA: hypothetical protein [Caudoviricetes sp.]